MTIGIISIIFILIAGFLLFGKRNNSRSDADEIKYPHPSQEVIAKRAICIAAIIARGDLELSIQKNSEGIDSGKDFVNKTKNWFKEHGVADALSTDERILLEKPVGSWSAQDCVNASWRAESLGLMLWALSLIDAIPSYDKEFNVVELNKIILNGPIDIFYKKCHLRHKEELEKARDVAEFWHWRSVTTRLIGEGKVPHDLDINKVIKTSAESAHAELGLSKPVDDDVVLFGKPYKKLESQEYSLATSIALERHFALNWLNGYSNDWDKTPTNT